MLVHVTRYLNDDRGPFGCSGTAQVTRIDLGVHASTVAFRGGEGIPTSVDTSVGGPRGVARL